MPDTNSPPARIDREAVVSRHRVTHREADLLAPLYVGNGELGYTVDVTGMQTFAAAHEARHDGQPAMPLGTMAQWSFHEMPNPEGWTLDNVMVAYDSPHGLVDYPADYDFMMDEDRARHEQGAGYWHWVNPQRYDLGKIGLKLTRADGTVEEDLRSIERVEQTLDPWTGIVTSSFVWDGAVFRVLTACAPYSDTIAIRIESSALGDGRAAVRFAFPYASDTFGHTVDWEREDAHRTRLRAVSACEAIVHRELDDARYLAGIRWSGTSTLEQIGTHELVLSPDGDVLEFTVAFALDEDALPSRQDAPAVFENSRTHWRGFWNSGAAIDLAGSADARATELERRIVLSQYATATQCSGRYPSAETGLILNSWAGKFHLEMHFWHAAHFAMWGRPELLERSFSWYLDILPVAQDIARRQGYAGARWPKHVGPEGRESPNDIGPLLAWQQPHPIHLAELLRRTSEDPAAVVTKYAGLVESTAEFMASFLTEMDDGLLHLVPPLMPAQEVYDARTVYDPPFELAYFWWGLSTAQAWRELRGEEPHPEWASALERFAPVPLHDSGVLAAVGNPPRTERVDHPSLLGALGVIPQTPLVHPDVMRRTYDEVVATWNWPRSWGWDFPVLAMCAARMGDPAGAVSALTMETDRNTYLVNGFNCQSPTRLPVYLPGNGGLLAAVAVMAGGWEGSPELPGFTADGWSVRAEGFPVQL